MKEHKIKTHECFGFHKEPLINDFKLISFKALTIFLMSFKYWGRQWFLYAQSNTHRKPWGLELLGPMTAGKDHCEQCFDLWI